nr:MAG TPA: hypothetical protein [Caudoviricetes sp.]
MISQKLDWSFNAFLDACADVDMKPAMQARNRKRAVKAAKKQKRQAALCGVAYAAHKSIVNIIRRS